jgi:Excalibur calcium-binding domain
MGLAQPAAASLAMPLKRPRDSLARPLNPTTDKVEGGTGCGAAWLARLSGGQEVPGSNPGTPTRETCRKWWVSSFSARSKVGAHDRTTGTPVTTFYRSTRLYNIAMSYNGQRGYNLDRDHDGIACEKR